jgi:hypothetical protein
LAELIRTSARLGRKQRIDPDTQLSRDLKLNNNGSTVFELQMNGVFGIRLSPEIAGLVGQ